METTDVLSPSAADASVRPATAADLPAIGAVHARAWTITYRDLFPDAVREHLTAAALTDAWRPHLDAARTAGHHLLVACTGPTVVGFAALGPAPDQPGTGPDDAELSTLLIDPVHHRHGHGSRLLAAGVDVLREDGTRRLITWLPADDEPRAAFLRSAGFAPDGAWRHLDLPDPGGEPQDASQQEGQRQHGVREVRYVAGLTDA